MVENNESRGTGEGNAMLPRPLLKRSRCSYHRWLTITPYLPTIVSVALSLIIIILFTEDHSKRDLLCTQKPTWYVFTYVYQQYLVLYSPQY